MKRLFTALALLLTITLSTSAMSYDQARDEALFLTDKMAYELNLTDEQYEAAYEINLDYLMRIDNYDDLYGTYWRQRNLDLSYILLDWQYRAYCDASYFYRPLYWSDGFWHFGIYARYPHRDYFFFGCPDFVFSYNGGHSWYLNGGRSWYYGRRWVGPRDGGPHPGMRRGWDNGRYGDGYVYEPGRRTWAQASPQRVGGPNNNRSFGNRSFGNMQRGGVNDSPLRTGNRSFGSQSQSQARPRSFGMSTDSNRSFGIPRESSTRSTVNRSSERSFGSGVFGNHSASPRSTFTPQQSAPARTFSAPTRSSSEGSFGGHSTGSFGGHSSSSFGSGRSNGGSFGGGSFGGGRSSNGGGSFGRR
jgi:hypothetical protein